MNKFILSILLFGITSTLTFAKGEVKEIYAHYEKPMKSSYLVNRKRYKWGSGKNLVIDGFNYNNHKYLYKTMAGRIEIIRKDNRNAQGKPCGIFVQYKRNNSKRNYNLSPTYPQDCDMANIMGGRIINIGVLDLFINKGYTAKNIERVDFIYDDGIVAPDKDNLEKSGHVVTEKSGNNPIKIAAILSLDDNGKPASYGKLITIDKIGRGASHSYGIAKIYLPNFHVIKKQHLMFLTSKNSKKPIRAASSYEPMGMSFVSLKDLGIAPKTKYYGFSLFGEDVDNKKNVLTDVNTFPVGNQRDTADPYGGAAGYFQDVNYNDNNNDDEPEAPVCKSDTNLLKNPSFENSYYKRYWTGDIWDGSSYIVPDGKRYVYVDKNHNGYGYQDVEVQAGKSYKLSFNAAMRRSYKGQKVIMEYLDKNKNTLNVKSEVEIRNNILPSRLLIPYTLSISNAPSNAKYLRVKFVVGKGDYLKVDNFDLRTDCDNQIAKIFIDDAEVMEGDNGTQTITFKINSDIPIRSITGAKINYELKAGTATKGIDYINSKGSFIIPKDQKTFELSLPIIKGDKKVEGNEQFYIKLYSDDVDFSKSNATGTIIDDDYNIVFNVVTKGSPFFNGKITTQIVNKPFNITISAYNKTLKKAMPNIEITKIDLVDINKNKYSNIFNGSFITKNDGTAITKINISKAYKDLKFKVTGIYKGKEYSNLSNDDFAVRPKKFVMTINNKNISGKNFKISIMAVDENGFPSSNYNETIKSSFDVQYRENNNKCTLAPMKISGLSFKDGKADYPTNYPEVGNLDFNISEIPNQEFAVIDANDGISKSDLFITDSVLENIEFTIDHFDISGVDLVEGSKNFTYYAPFDSMQKMAEKIKFNLTAKNIRGKTTKNYNKICHAKDTMVSINFDAKTTPSEHNILNWQEDGNKNHSKKNAVSFDGSVNNSSFIYDVSKNDFNNGESNNSIRINFKREYNIPKEPMRFTLKKIIAVNKDNKKGTVSVDHTGYYYYGRLHGSDYMKVGTKLNAIIFHEVYCNKCDSKNIFTLADNPESVDQIRWYRINDYDDGISGFKASSVTSANYNFNVELDLHNNIKMSSSNLEAKTNSLDMITFNVPRKFLPLKDRIIYTPQPWLVYKMFKSTDLRHSFTISLAVPPRKWAGKGNTGKTVDMYVSPRRTGIKIDW